MKNSFIELHGRARALALLDRGSFKELLDPFDRVESPYLAPQGIVPESDDGVIIARGTLDGREVVLLSMEGAFQGGGIGEVGGSKIAGSLERALVDNCSGKKIIPIIIFDTGGVRLQEANYGLLVIAEIQSAIVALRAYVPVIGLVPGNIGCFGGMSITAALCSSLIFTEAGRFALNGPEVIETEAGVQEFNSHDHRMVSRTIGGTARFETGLADQLIEDDVEAFKKAILGAIAQRDKMPRTQMIERFLSVVERLDPSKKNTSTDVARLLHATEKVGKIVFEDKPAPSRGRSWFKALTGDARSISEYPSVLVADIELGGRRTRFVAVVPNEANRYPRAVHGEVGLLEGWAVAKYVREAIAEDASSNEKRNIVAIIDVPSQAYGFNEEVAGISFACAAGVDAYASARLSGHAVAGLIVGNAISGGFLTHGLQSSRLIALDDEGINVQAMSKKSAARITKRTIKEIEEAAGKVPAIAYDVRSYFTLGPLDELVEDVNADDPRPADVKKVTARLSKAIGAADTTIAHRLETPAAVGQGRVYGLLVRSKIGEQWS